MITGPNNLIACFIQSTSTSQDHFLLEVFPLRPLHIHVPLYMYICTYLDRERERERERENMHTVAAIQKGSRRVHPRRPRGGSDSGDLSEIGHQSREVTRAERTVVHRLHHV